MSDERLYINELASFVDRRPNTIRGWERDGELPNDLLPERDHKGWRYWRQNQAEAIKRWIEQEDRRPGKGLLSYKPSPEEIKNHIMKTRRPRNEV